MTEKLQTIIVDASTGTVVQRELTSEELAERQILLSEIESLNQAKEEARTSALAKLAALGLTEEEIAAL
jgi:hypothetical protein